MPYTLPAWVDSPDPSTPLSAANLLTLNSAVADLDARVNLGYGHPWETRVYGDDVSTCNRHAATSTYAMTSSLRTLVILLGQAPAGSYSGFSTFQTTAQSGGTMTAALYATASRADTSWARLGAGNITPTLSAGLVTSSLAFTLASDPFVALELVLTSAPTTYPIFAATVAGQAGLINGGSGAVITGSANASTTPGATLNPTTGFTAVGQKVWAAIG